MQRTNLKSSKLHLFKKFYAMFVMLCIPLGAWSQALNLHENAPSINGELKRPNDNNEKISTRTRLVTCLDNQKNILFEHFFKVF
jgi:hypothetical protein